MRPYRILVTGSRDWRDKQRLRDALDLAVWGLTGNTHSDVTIVTGACPTGADAMAERWAYDRGYKVERHPADWSQGPGAGPARNYRMVAMGADVCLAFIRNNSRGATGCARMAEAADIQTFRVREN